MLTQTKMYIFVVMAMLGITAGLFDGLKKLRGRSYFEEKFIFKIISLLATILLLAVDFLDIWQINREIATIISIIILLATLAMARYYWQRKYLVVYNLDRGQLEEIIEGILGKYEIEYSKEEHSTGEGSILTFADGTSKIKITEGTFGSVKIQLIRLNQLYHNENIVEDIKSYVEEKGLQTTKKATTAGVLDIAVSLCLIAFIIWLLGLP